MQVNMDHVSLKQIEESGQCFRWIKLGPDRYGIPAFGIFTIAEQKKSGTLDLDCSTDQWEKIWAPYFDAKVNYGDYIRCVDPGDLYLGQAIQTCSGIRILKQDLWEMMVTFILSQNNNIARIKTCLERLCHRFGALKNYHGISYYSFPEAAALTEPDALAGLGLGYREKYVRKLARDVAENRTLDLTEIKRMNYLEARQKLKSLYGVGDKVADCICLFGLGQKEAFPVDRWIHRVIDKYYGGKFPLERYGSYAGVMQQYIFCYEMTRQ